MTARNEQETTVSAGRDDEWVFVWTNNPVHARRLDADDRAVLVTELEVQDFSVSLRKATAQVTRTAATGGSGGRSQAPVTDEPWAAPSGAETGAQQWATAPAGGADYGDSTPF